jgi:hypothetical protein
VGFFFFFKEMESLDTAAGFMVDDLLDFCSDIGEGDDDEEHQNNNKKPRKGLPSLNPNALASASFNVLEHALLPVSLLSGCSFYGFLSPEVAAFGGICPLLGLTRFGSVFFWPFCA